MIDALKNAKLVFLLNKSVIDLLVANFVAYNYEK